MALKSERTKEGQAKGRFEERKPLSVIGTQSIYKYNDNNIL